MIFFDKKIISVALLLRIEQQAEKTMVQQTEYARAKKPIPSDVRLRAPRHTTRRTCAGSSAPRRRRSFGVSRQAIQNTPKKTAPTTAMKAAKP
jgi:hypothetical protein